MHELKYRKNVSYKKVASIIKYNLSKIIAITEKNIKSRLRFKYEVVIGFISPIIGIILPIIILGKIFEYNTEFGIWTINNILIYQFIAYNISLFRSLIGVLPSQFKNEKIRQTLPALIIAPSHRINLLIGIFLSHIIFISIPFVFFTILCFIISPISLLTFLAVILNYFLISLIFIGVGHIVGIFAISKPNMATILSFIISLIFIFSCVTYPFEIFPEPIQFIVNLNPLYHLFDFLRLTWIQNNFILTLTSNLDSFLIILAAAIILPTISIKIFNEIYNKYGIVGA